jgi:vacuolar-type H+-ATPase subunit C/Vma6
MTRKVAAIDYAYAIGRIRALENFLLKEEIFTQAMEENLSAALELLAESGIYSDELLHVRTSGDLEKLLDQESRELKKFIQDLLLDETLRHLLDTDSLKEMQRIVRVYSSKFLSDYFNYLIDLHNIKTFLRLSILHEPEEVLAQRIDCQGFISRQDFLSLFPHDLSSFFSRIEYVLTPDGAIDYYFVLKEEIDKAVKEHSFVSLEKEINNMLIHRLRPAKFFTFGPEPVLAYYFARLNEINLIRMIILAKLNKLSSEIIKERLNVVYA